jgi:hypothetical protein
MAGSMVKNSSRCGTGFSGFGENFPDQSASHRGITNGGKGKHAKNTKKRESDLPEGNV